MDRFAGNPITVYPAAGATLISEIVGAALLSGLIGVAAVAALGWGVHVFVSGNGADVLVAVALIAVGVGALVLFVLALTRWLWPLLTQTARKEPYFRVDDDGLECSRGRVRWRDVERVALTEDESSNGPGTPWLILKLHAGTDLAPVASAYYDGPLGIAKVTPLGLEVTVWTCRRQALKAIRRFYSQPVLTVKQREDL
jgi:hypothetical protein